MIKIIVKKNAKAINTEIIESTNNVFPISSNRPLICPSTKGSRIALRKRYRNAIRIVCIVGIDIKTNIDTKIEFPVIAEAVDE